MDEPAAVATARTLLDGCLSITLPPETHAQLTADHARLAEIDHTREPLIVTAWLANPQRPAHSYTAAAAPDAEGVCQLRELRDRVGHALAGRPMERWVVRIVDALREQVGPGLPEGEEAWFTGHLVYDVADQSLALFYYAGAATANTRGVGSIEHAREVATVWCHEQRLAGREIPVLALGHLAPMAGVWELDATRAGVELTEGRDDTFDTEVRLWLTYQYTPAVKRPPWQPVVGSAVQIRDDGTLRERVSTTPSQLPWWGIDGIRRDCPLPVDGRLVNSGGLALQTDTSVDGTGRPTGHYGRDARVRDVWCRELDGSLVRTVHAFDPTGRTLTSRDYRYRRSTTVPDTVFEAPAPTPVLPPAPSLTGVWELRSWVAEPDIMQFRDQQAWESRSPHWARPMLTEIPAHGWQDVTGTRLTIRDDGTFTEEVIGNCALRWWDEDVIAHDSPVPFDGYVDDTDGTCLVPSDLPVGHCRRQGDVSQAVDQLYPRFDGSLVRVQSVKFDDGYLFSRSFLRYEKVG